jgi:hypothetical protein
VVAISDSQSRVGTSRHAGPFLELQEGCWPGPKSLSALRERSVSGYTVVMRDASWVKARITARILIRQHRGKIFSRDKRLARILSGDDSVTDRLIDQAIASLCAQKGLNYQEYASIGGAVAS